MISVMTCADLPDLVLLKVLQKCSENIEDIYNLRATNKHLCRFIDQNWRFLFNINLVLSNFPRCLRIDMSKPVLNLKLNILLENFKDREFYNVVQVDSISACETDKYYIYEDELGKRLPLIIKPTEFSNISELEFTLARLNLNNLHSLDLIFEGFTCFRYPYHVILLNSRLKSQFLKQLRLDVNFLCGYCTEFVANIQSTFPQLKLLDISNVVQTDSSSIDVMICLSLTIFERFAKDGRLRKTLVRNIPFQCLEDLDECKELGELTFQVLPHSDTCVTLQFG